MEGWARSQLAGPRREEALAALPVLRADAEDPCGEIGIRDVVGRRFGLFPQPDRSDAEWDAWWGDYFDALADLPIAAVEAGMRAWVRHPDSEFMPRPGKLRELALSTPNNAASLYARMKSILYPATPQQALPAPEERVKPEEVAEMMAEFRKRMSANKLPEPPKFRVQAKIDERGVSDVMRRKLNGEDE